MKLVTYLKVFPTSLLSAMLGRLVQTETQSEYMLCN